MAILNDLLNQVRVNPNIAPPSSGQGASSLGIDLNGAANPQTVIYNAALILIWVLGLAAVITFIIAGVRYITAGGDAEKAESAKKIIIGSIIGMLLIMTSYVIFNSAVATLQGQDSQRVLNQTYR